MRSFTPNPLSMESILAGFLQVGLQPGDFVLVHTSLSSFGHVEGGAQTLVEALLKAVSPDGNVMVPTLTGSEKLSPDHPPRFNPRTSECWTGALPRLFRSLPEAKRSLHPTHSVAVIGPRAEEILQGHELCTTPCAGDSPYGKLYSLDGKILLLGVDHESSTYLHTLEEMASVPYHLQPTPTRAIIETASGEQEVSFFLHQYGTPRCFNRIDRPLDELGIQRKITIGKALIRCINVRALTDWLLPILSSDPWYLAQSV